MKTSFKQILGILFLWNIASILSGEDSYFKLQEALLIQDGSRFNQEEQQLADAISEAYQNFRGAVESGEVSEVQSFYESLKEDDPFDLMSVNPYIFQILPEYYLYVNGLGNKEMVENLVRNAMPQVLDDLVLNKEMAGLQRNTLANDLSVEWFRRQYDLKGSLSDMQGNEASDGVYALDSFVQDIRETKDYYSFESALALYDVLLREARNGISDDYLFVIIGMPWTEMVDDRSDLQEYFKAETLGMIAQFTDISTVIASNGVKEDVFESLLKESQVRDMLTVFRLGEVDYANDTDQLAVDLRGFLRRFGIVVY